MNSDVNATGARSLLPTRKWWAALITALTAVVINWIQAGAFSKEILIALIGVVSQAAVSYLVPNESTPGGVPLKR
ncbi:hypothetical protein Acsp04_41830 [Actinomadura sp. NBRC 104425]|uniref:hypothetical protein n=1 Tax=Actinomadura sp. NBRC 104425 TaxID=3032204 RepID=UPI0024A34CD9|nr:hypothetical protein [Actinomadura sp. NBRC 104425]GLZ13948.1 hypothetical protein Acsp04_41830 [Actinomadura sp. NBRC 104425]